MVKSNTVWLYTRVSSKTQFERNGSIDTQLEESKGFAEKNNLEIVKTFGGSYESAKGDFTRKEFKSLIDEVKRKRTKPYAILIYKINRFSRSGGSAIGLVDDLVQRQGVHLIETYSGNDNLDIRASGTGNILFDESVIINKNLTVSGTTTAVDLNLASVTADLSTGDIDIFDNNGNKLVIIDENGALGKDAKRFGVTNLDQL